LSNSDAQFLEDVAAAMRAGQFAQASGMADAALARGSVHPLLFQARALHLDKLGKGGEALQNFLKAQSLSPRDPVIANGVAICLGRLGRLKEAMTVFNTALAWDPNLVTTHFNMGWVLEMHEQYIAACEAYRRAAERAPQYVAAWAGLATASEAIHDWESARAAATHALGLDPRQPRVILSLARSEIEQSRFDSAEVRLRAAFSIPGFVPEPLRVAMLGLLADALDGQGNVDEAFAFYTTANNEKRSSQASRLPSFDMVALVHDLTAYFERSDPACWSLPADDVEKKEYVREHVFLMGFPRSGTTLLEQVLAANSDVVTLEESNVLDPVAEEFLRTVGGVERFASLSGEDIAQIRAGYWQRVLEHGLGIERKIFVDKLPLNTIKLPLIAKLFPKAKILFAVRDPRDVVFSCFRRPFSVNASTFEFLTLDGAAHYYDSVMKLGKACCEKLPLSFHQYRHEDLVRDFDGEMRNICRFVGIDWVDRFRNFSLIAQQRNIRSISASQVRRGLNSDGYGQWRRYAARLEPILPILRPWVEEFGYEPA
jgi:tetratricopeptide (TPR) repeat protein